MVKDKLPEEWKETTLGKIVQYGKTQKCELSDIKSNVWVLELEDIEKNTSKIIQKIYVSERSFKSTKNEFKKGYVLYGKLRPYLNKVVIADADGVCSTEIVPLDAEPFIDNRYLFYWLKSSNFLGYVTEVSYGVNMPRLGTNDGVAAPFTLAPLAEQKVIADKLDTLLAQVENTKARLDRIPKILKQFRQSVLAAAVSGKLTEDWREGYFLDNIRPSRGKEKFSKKLYDAAKKTLPSLPESWLIIPAGTVLNYITSGSRGWSTYYSTFGALFLRMANVKYDSTKLSLSDLQYVMLPENVEGKRSLVQLNDLLISITADVGRVARVDQDFKEAYVNQHLALARPTDEINSEYLAICVASKNIGLKQINELKRGVTKAGLGLDDIRSLAIPYPPLEEQTEIVHRVEKLFAFADSIEAQVKMAQEKVNNLTQSLLAKAFRGELTAKWREEHPELISGENSAQALLERIQAERATLQAMPKGKKNSRTKQVDK